VGIGLIKVLVAHIYFILAAVEMSIYYSDRGLAKFEPDRDCSFVSHHFLETCGKVTVINLSDERYHRYVGKKDKVSGLKRH